MGTGEEKSLELEAPPQPGAGQSKTDWEHEYRRLFEGAREGLLIVDAASGKIEDVNSFLCQLLGYERDGLLGQELWAIGAFQSLAGHLKAFLALLENVSSQPASLTLEDKERRPVFIEFVATRYECAGRELVRCNIRDLTGERRQVAETVRQERTFSESILNSLPGVFYLYDHNGRFVRWNDNFERVSGYTASEIGAMHPLDFFAEADKELLAARIGEVFEKGESSVEAGFVSKDGRTTPYYFTGILTKRDGEDCLVGVGIDISERKRAEELLRTSEGRYRTLFEWAPAGILIADCAGTYIDANTGICAMLGYGREELLGLDATHIVVPEEIENIDPALEDIQTKQDYRREWKFRRKNGSVFEAEVLATILPDGNIVAMIRDITERNEAEAKLRNSEAHMAQAQRIARLGSWEFDILDRRLHWSEQTSEIFGLRESDVAKNYELVLERIHPQDRERFEVAQRAALEGIAELDLEFRIVLEDGSEKYLHELGDLRRDKEGRPLLLAGTVLDISERKAAELALRELNQNLEFEVAMRTSDLQAALIRAEAADKFKSAFLATMSHELRTPLNSIIGFTGILLQCLAGPLTEEQAKQLGMVRQSSRHLLQLINDVLDISKIEAGQLTVNAQPFRLKDSLESVTAIVKPLAEKKGLTLNLVIPADLGEAVSDQRRVEQILLNLLSNAAKFTESGSVTLMAEIVGERRASSDAVPGAASQRSVWLRVEDTGIGIRKEDLTTLFQPFRQLDTGLARQSEGTGLGLAISRRLAALLGGEILATSKWEEGSAFTFILPLP